MPLITQLVEMCVEYTLFRIFFFSQTKNLTVMIILTGNFLLKPVDWIQIHLIFDSTLNQQLDSASPAIM